MAIGALSNFPVEYANAGVPVLLYGADGSALVKLEDAAHASGDPGIMALAVRKDAAAALATTDGDYIPLIVDASGRLHVAPLVAGSAIVGKVGIDQTTPGTTNLVDTELPAARLAADTLALPTAPDVLALGMLWNGSTLDRAKDAPGVSDGMSGTGVAAVAGMVWAGSNWERAVSNSAGATALSSAARTATNSSSPQTNRGWRGIRVFVNVTAAVDTPSVVFTIEVADPLSGVYTALLTSAAITGTGHHLLEVAPGITPVANLAVAKQVGRTWRVTATHADSDSITYSVAWEGLV